MKQELCSLLSLSVDQQTKCTSVVTTKKLLNSNQI